MPVEKFMTRVRKSDDGCWHWIGIVQLNGYGTFKIGGRLGEYVRAHRIAYTLFNGDIPTGLLVCHRCDVRHCVNPGHLFVGTDLDNMRDMVSKGRQCWSHTGASKLSSDQIRQLRFSDRPMRELISEFGISKGYAYHVRRGDKLKQVA